MNRPSRTEDDMEHPAWNQNPPFLAPDLTTRQDLNGIANARVQRTRCRDVFGLDEKHVVHVFGGVDWDPNPCPPSIPATDGTNVPFVAPKSEAGGAGQPRPSPTARLSGWAGWIASVVVASTLLSLARDWLRPQHGPVPSRAAAPPAFSSEPARLARRQDACGQRAGAGTDYNVPLHVGALFIILGVSSLACGFPLLAARFPALKIPEGFFFAVRHFGTGVLLATAFVHLLPTAFISLGDPCLSSFWTTDYPAIPGAIALFGIFFVTVIEMVFSPARQFVTREGQVVETESSDPKEKAGGQSGMGHCSHPNLLASVTRRSEGISMADTEGRAIRNVPGDALDASLEEASSAHILTPEQQHKKDIMQCMMLEVGILFHSVFIGMAVSVAVGKDFVVLLIAIAFHQTFEGLALGARISAISWPERTYQPWLMVLAYGCTTPIGQAIGLATHSLYDPDSEFGLILVGTMNAVSSGLLVFASLIELLAEDFLSDHSWTVMRGRKRVFACFLVLLGAALMSLVGAWA
ncbi:zinc-regulated transporter 2 [Echria macrotheca]|uniref:Zinc-regulated transporter 2 n=1 Tax=Echria macrotheca TaxID=438768 RepID=A0AAJ0B6H6_9PEZI|nr:zinc-regulated transporter 2 [Echria macrotheca]